MLRQWTIARSSRSNPGSGGKPSIRGMRITVSDIQGWLASGVTREQIRDEFPEITEEDIQAVLAFAANATSGVSRPV